MKKLESAQERLMAFYLCHDWVMQNAKAVYCENFFAIYGLCRNMIGVTIIAFVATLIILWHKLSGSVLQEWAIWVSVLCFFGYSCRLFWSGMHSWARKHVQTVYRSFYVGTFAANED
jgi:hypothetical protein